MKTILSKFKKWKTKKAAADLVSIIVSVVLISALVIGILLFLSNKVKNTAMDEINNTMNTITAVAEANRNNTDVVIPDGGSGDESEEPEVNVPVTHEGIIPEGGVYYVGVTSYTKKQYNGTNVIKYNPGDAFPETVKNGDVYVYEGYEYRYNCYGSNDYDWKIDNSLDGWGVKFLNLNSSLCGNIIDTINGKDIKNLNCVFYGFNGCKIEQAPRIPRSVTHMSMAFQNCYSLTTPPNMKYATNVKYIANAFASCSSLEGEIEINANPISYNYCFGSTEKPIKIIGSCSEETKANLAGTANNNNVTY